MRWFTIDVLMSSRARTSLARVYFFALLAPFLLVRRADAQVTEPNGTVVPGPSSQANETSLQAYFDSQNEMINARMEASADPGVFSPLCNFTATLVLSQSNAAAGLAWYNVPASPTAKPDKLFQILPEANNPTGATINATDIRASADYAGGFIGFALTKNLGTAGTPIYYSEYQRNVNCTGCATPGYWKMMLAYRSTAHQSSYYIAFEDWEGANDREWFGNDGDFNDKVFLVTGVSCPGGGEPCDTGKQGLCAAGLTACSFTGMPECKPQYTPTAEKCDNIDNDCNGQVDDGNLCAMGKVCVRGKCVAACNTGEFYCTQPLVCGSDAFCIEAACKDVVCGPGLACRAGKCVGACEGVVCPIGQVCQGDRCLDPCTGITCASGTFCDHGVCVGDCTCSGCPKDKKCARDGRCVAPGCEGLSCPAGQGCRDGKCVDSCSGAMCPGAAMCANGACGEPIITGGGDESAGTGNVGGVPIITNTGGIAVISSGGTGSGPRGGNSATSGSSNGREGGKAGCACRTASGGRTSALDLLAAGALGALLLLRRRRSQFRD
ncbi:MAG TPA: hypothetical protein VG937_13860 [Polyangiaceae bacterium]|nr:hypothetical protein [Polyangiaceae bacterium]